MRAPASDRSRMRPAPVKASNELRLSAETVGAPPRSNVVRSTLAFETTFNVAHALSSPGAWAQTRYEPGCVSLGMVNVPSPEPSAVWACRCGDALKDRARGPAAASTGAGARADANDVVQDLGGSVPTTIWPTTTPLNVSWMTVPGA